MKAIKFILIIAILFTASCLWAQETPKPPKPPKKVHVIKNADSIDADTSDIYIDMPEINIPDIHIPEIKVSLEQEKKILSEMVPKLREQMQRIKKLDKMKYNNLLMDSQFRLFELPIFGKRDKEASERIKKITGLEIETEALGLEYKKADKAEREKIKQDLLGKLNDLFELRENNRKEEVKDLEGRLTELNRTLDERRKNKDKIINNRLNDLTGEDEDTEW